MTIPAKVGHRDEPEAAAPAETPARSKTPRRLIPVLKWGGCVTALVFAAAGLLLDLALSGSPYQSLSRGSWVIVAVAMAIALTGVVLDRSHRLP